MVESAKAERRSILTNIEDFSQRELGPQILDVLTETT